uniref:VPS9 domain-containing protein n=1 Tax=Ananas comosus var. bracteatus TaxID=296719 RepID=A0A6V7Q2Z2_ANACO|nr:unnamed protein product [Ananas comosus var. bracteatus]
MYKAPRDKLVCILNCCKVINNLLLNVFIASDENPPGADEFLPVLIYVIIKANPPQLHSNLLYIQRYRHLENKGSSDLLKDDHLIRYFQQYPFLYARAGDLSVEDVENLLNCYKKLVLKYISLSKGMGVINESLPGQNMQMLSKTETLKEFDDAKVLGINSEKDEGIYREDDVSIENLLSGGDDSETKRTSGGLVDNPSAEREKEVCP